ncbi:MAG: LuxR C-terminal-related transcriptional regulator [Pantoea sp.]|uniref:helix-turn-helix transcriptional regulator n=1 Tax=Pantoea sp. TaxID=69393 RepID=UPI00290F2F7E|nr:LuxR C-terminal-related transcriptional regulator [Pantoea sp.]MDU5779804.1 LuxR C-terminal-related transcriptional regulator [Pantoea sp.]
MLKVLLVDYNFYHRKGLSTLISNHVGENQKLCFLIPSEENNEDDADIIFRNDMATIHIVNKNSTCGANDKNNQHYEKITIHFPFLTKKHSVSDISIKIEKILAIANLDYHLLANNREEVYWRFGLKEYAQLSDTENDVMILVGRGYNSADISKILNRSPKTISTHFRNASRKMGAANRAEFCRYASYIANCQRDNGITLCL